MAVWFILLSFIANYASLCAMELNVIKEITCK